MKEKIVVFRFGENEDLVTGLRQLTKKQLERMILILLDMGEKREVDFIKKFIDYIARELQKRDSMKKTLDKKMISW
jgi:hypothetical protein